MGHLGARSEVEANRYIAANNIIQAQQYANSLPGLKHRRTQKSIRSLQEISCEEYLAGKKVEQEQFPLQYRNYQMEQKGLFNDNRKVV